MELDNYKLEMKHSLQLKISQSLTMTPQLQQAIRLLQLSSIELQTEIQDALDSNMMLELEEEQDTDIAAADTQAEQPDSDPDLFNLTGLIYLEQKNFVHAFNHFRKAIQKICQSTAPGKISMTTIFTATPVQRNRWNF